MNANVTNEPVADLPGETWGCTWAQNKRCREEATHWHKIYGELCPEHAAKVMMLHPKDCVGRITIQG